MWKFKINISDVIEGFFNVEFPPFYKQEKAHQHQQKKF
jgi:hypothetical protein